MKSMRFAKLMKSMGIDKKPEEPRVFAGERQLMSPEKTEAISGMEHPELQENRKMKMIIDAKISQLEQSQDPADQESLLFWKQRRDSLLGPQE